MTVWSEDKIRGFSPKEHQLECQIWRDFSSLLGMNVDTKSKQPGVIHWLQLLDDEIEEIKPLHICITGTKYKWQSPAWQFVDYIQDSLAINASLLDKMNEVWIQEIVKSLVRTENAVRSFGNFATNLAEVSGDSLQENSLKKSKKLERPLKKKDIIIWIRYSGDGCAASPLTKMNWRKGRLNGCPLPRKHCCSWLRKNSVNAQRRLS